MTRGNKNLIKITIITVFIAGIFMFGSQNKDMLSGKMIEVISSNSSVSVQKQWTLSEKISEARKMLEGINLYIGEDEISYYEDRIISDIDGNISKAQVTIQEEAKEIALALLNTETGEIQIIVIKKNGDEIQSPAGFDIDIVRRPSGIRWNYWNTEYKISAPENLIVIGNRYPILKNVKSTQRVRNSKGQMVSKPYTERIVEYIYYVPYSKGLHVPELIDAGREHLKNLVSEAFQTIEKRQVMSRAITDSKISSIEAFKPEFFARLPLIEQSDLGEFILDPDKTAERVLVIIGANGDEAYSKTCNGTGACGLVQFISSSYTAMRLNNPSAELIEDSMEGRADQVNVMIAAILHHDTVLNQLVDVFGEKILKDPKLEEYLAAGYNGSYAHVISSLNSTMGKKVSDWSKHLKKETLGFIVKLRYIRENEII